MIHCDRTEERGSTLRFAQLITLPSFHFCEPRSRVLCLSEDLVAMLALLLVVTMGADYYYYGPGKNGPEIGEIIRHPSPGPGKTRGRGHRTCSEWRVTMGNKRQ